MSTLKSIGIVGAGQMGSGIAHVIALGGYDVILNDLEQSRLDQALALIEKNMMRQVGKGAVTESEVNAALSRITPSTELSALANVDLAIEAATENEAIKRQVFENLCKHVAPNAYLATNTSSISITRLAASTDRPEKFIGLHFMNPVPLMKLVEIIRGLATDQATYEMATNLATSLDKTIANSEDFPAFIVNRILMPMINEAICSLHEGVAGVAEIDEVMKLGMAHPMGPLHLADFIGLDVCLSILKVLHDGFGQPKYAPSPLLVNMVMAGKLGVKSGEGFYVHTKGSKEIQVAPAFA